jgi:hypothetical protein
MNDITELKDYLIADEIERIQKLSNKMLIRELIEVQTRKIENLSDIEVMKMCQRNQNGN